MKFSSLHPWLAGAIIAVSIVGSASAQDAKAVFAGRYAELSAARQAKDTVALGKLMTPDFVMTDIQGTDHTAAEMHEAMGKRPGGGSGVSPKVTVISAQITGSTAQVEQQMEIHMERPGPDGTPMKLDVTVLTADVWVQSGGAWLLKSSNQKDISVAKAGEVVFHQAK
jgi:ketosteroid isomerase-like protein